MGITLRRQRWSLLYRPIGDSHYRRIVTDRTVQQRDVLMARAQRRYPCTWRPAAHGYWMQYAGTEYRWVREPMDRNEGERLIIKE